MMDKNPSNRCEFSGWRAAVILIYISSFLREPEIPVGILYNHSNDAELAPAPPRSNRGKAILQKMIVDQRKQNISMYGVLAVNDRR